MPFTTETSPFGGGVNPKQASRKDVFDYCISELTDLASDESAMPAARSNYPRADKGAVNGLLARMYLNAEVYAGTPMWTEAKSACEAIFGMGYSLCPEYSDLFRGDNGENADALKEIIFGVAYDAEQTQSYGGTSYLTLAAIAATDVTAEQKINGVNNGWAGIRVPYEYVQKYFNARNADYTTGEYTVNDKRGGMFYIKGRQESMNDALYVFLNGWTCLKFNNIPHDMTNDEFLATATSKAYSDIDFPMIRLGEIYLIYAEACMNLGQANTALPKLKELTDRAGVSAPSSVTADYLLEERARELMWEGHRRTDLIRYGKFTTPSFLWTYKGGTFTGQGFDDYMKIFAIPSSELASKSATFALPKSAAGTECSFYAVANYDASSAKTRAALTVLVEKSAADYNGTFAEVSSAAKRSGGFVMSGSTSKTIGAVNSTTSVGITLKRTVAKVALQTTIDPSFADKYAGELTINSVKLSKAASQSSVVAGTPTPGAMSYTHTQTLAAASGKYNALFYCFENGSLTAGNRVLLEINATYDLDGNGSTTDDRSEVTYSVELTGKAAGEILRNGYYRIAANITGLVGQDCAVTVTVADWETPVTQSVELGA